MLPILAFLFSIVLGPERQLAGASNERFAATNNGYVAFWNEGADANAARLSLDGDVVRRATLFHDRYVAGAARDGDDLVVVTQRSRSVVSAVELFRVSAALDVVAGPVFVGSGRFPQVAAAPGGFLVGWQVDRTACVMGETLIVSQFDAALTLVRERVLDVAPSTRVGDYLLASGDGETLVAWNELTGCECHIGLPCAPRTRVRAARLRDDLTIADPAGVAIGPEDNGLADAWWNGAEWEIAWQTAPGSVMLSRLGLSPSPPSAPVALHTAPPGDYNVHAFRRGAEIVVAANFVGTHESGFAIGEARIFLPILSGSVILGDDGRALFWYRRYPGVVAYYRVVDFNDETARPRPARR